MPKKSPALSKSTIIPSRNFNASKSSGSSLYYVLEAYKPPYAVGTVAWGQVFYESGTFSDRWVGLTKKLFWY
jgi:hypothetical protein